MTEAEWLYSTDPMTMLNWLNEVTGYAYGYPAERARKPSDRKLRLFAAACYRDVAEAARPFADAYRAADEAEFWAEQGHAAPGVRESSIPVDTHDRAIDHAIGAATWAHYHRGNRTLGQLNATQAALLRTIVGNPFKVPPVMWHAGQPYCNPKKPKPWPEPNDPVHAIWAGHAWEMCPWLTHADGTVPKFAQVIYDERRWDLMPMLADALEDAGCRDEVMLRWCRGKEVCPDCMGEGELRAGSSAGIIYSQCRRCVGPDGYGTGWIPRCGPSVRGDWVIDLLTGKE